jgi:iron complex outermembrane receptor protein
MGGSVKGVVNLPLSPELAVRAVGCFTRYAGFIDAVFPGGVTKKNVHDGYRAGGRIVFGWTPTETLSITPRVLYQKIDVNGFNRRDVFNIYGSQYTNPPVLLGDNEQVLLRDENFSEESYSSTTISCSISARSA